MKDLSNEEDLNAEEIHIYNWLKRHNRVDVDSVLGERWSKELYRLKYIGLVSKEYDKFSQNGFFKCNDMTEIVKWRLSE
jgi:hypothetical protein